MNCKELDKKLWILVGTLQEAESRLNTAYLNIDPHEIIHQFTLKNLWDAREMLKGVQHELEKIAENLKEVSDEGKKK